MKRFPERGLMLIQEASDGFSYPVGGFRVLEGGNLVGDKRDKRSLFLYPQEAERRQT